LKGIFASRTRMPSAKLELNRVKAQLWSRMAAAMREIQGMAENEPSRHRATIPAKLLPKGIDGTKP